MRSRELTEAWAPPGELTESLPNVLVIGAAKCGTTSVHFYLDQHPEITMSEPKELRFFWRSDWREQLDAYASTFDPSARFRGESTPGYTIYPYREHVPERMHAAVPDAKLIYIVRDPVARAVSHWIQARADRGYRATEPGFPRWTLTEAITARDDPTNAVIRAGMYATQLDRYLRHFHRSQILIVDYDELRTERVRCMKRIFDFLGAAPFEPRDLEIELNARGEKRELSWAGEPLWNYVFWPLSRVVPKAARARLFPIAEGIAHRQLKSPVLTQADRTALERFYRPEVGRLRELTGLAFAGWSI
jgi:hypothetical protein